MAEHVDIHTLPEFLCEIPNLLPSHAVYRGVTDSDYSLTPSLARHLGKTPTKELVEGLAFQERRALLDFQRLGQAYGRRITALNFDLIALAAHYRLRTRLLDWTFNPLVALFFSVCDSTTASKDGAVHILLHSNLQLVDPLEADPFSQQSLMLLLPNHIDARMTAQDTVFTVHPPPWHPLDRGEAIKLRKLTIPKDSKATLRRGLQVCGIHEQAIFPGLEGLARFINFNYGFKGESSSYHSSPSDLAEPSGAR
jgi:hypothetical protein